MTEITTNDRASDVVRKANENFSLLGSNMQVLSTNDNAGNFVQKLNSNFAAVGVDGIVTMSADSKAHIFIQRLNENFNTAGSGQPSGDTQTVTVYDVSCGKSGGAVAYYPCSLSAGETVIVKWDSPSTEASAPSSNKFIKVKTYNPSKVAIDTLLDSSTSGVSIGGWGNEITLSNSAAYIGIQAYSGTYCSVEHNEQWAAEQVASKPLNGKKWLVIGDSISTEGSSYASTGYGKIASSEFGLREYNIAVSGTTTAEWISGSSRISTSWQSFSKQYDIISIMLGTNDQGYGSVSVNSYKSNCATLYNLCRQNWGSGVTIVFLTPIRRINRSGLSDYVDKMIEFCTENNVAYIDLYHDFEDDPAIDPNTSSEYRDTYFCPAATNDDGGTHPNDLGQATFIAPRVIKWFREYFNIPII